MSGVFGVGSMMSNYFGRSGRCKRCTFEPALRAKPARHALWVGSSYWGTRNRHPSTGHTPLVVVDKSRGQESRRGTFWLPGMGCSDSACLSNMFARQPQGVTADFWYPSMRRATPAAASQRRPTEVSKLSQRHWSQTIEYGVTPGRWNP
jgi:hypothetical protein